MIGTSLNGYLLVSEYMDMESRESTCYILLRFREGYEYEGFYTGNVEVVP